MKSIIALAIIGFIPASMRGTEQTTTIPAIQQPQPIQAPQSSQQNPQPQIIYVPVPITVDSQHKPTKPNIIPHVVSIVGNLGKIIVDPHNKPQLQQNITNMIDSIIAVAHEASHHHRSCIPETELIRSLITHLENVLVSQTVCIQF